MGLFEWPGQLPLPLLSGYNLKQQSNWQTTSMASGRTRVRQRFASVPTVAGCQWKFNASQAALFEGLIEHGAIGAGKSFLMKIRTPLGAELHECKLLNDPRDNYGPTSGRLWSYSATIEIRKAHVMSEQETAEALVSPGSIDEFNDGLSEAITDYVTPE